MFMSKRATLRTLASALEATKQTYARPPRGFRHSLAKEDNYQNHLMTTLRSVMANMAQVLCNNDHEAAKKLLESLSKA